MVNAIIQDINDIFMNLKNNFGLQSNQIYLIVKVSEQKMYVCRDSLVLKIYDVSTAKKGVGNIFGSYKTPLGVHKIVAKYGDNAPEGTIFNGRKETKYIEKIYTDSVNIDQDFVMTRILHLEGMEEGKNKGGNVDTFSRFIYIHGTPEEGLIGTPQSKGCIRMRNKEVIELYNDIPIGTIIDIIN